MTKGELRKARKAARASGKPLTGPLALNENGPEPIDFSETPRGYEGRHRWAKRYDELNGPPENDYDR